MNLREQLQDTVGHSYRLDSELGGGGMSRVFLAIDSAFGRKVVIKVLPPEMAAAMRIERFRREIQLAANLQHPHIVPLLAAGESNGLPYFVMPFVSGESLRERLNKEGELPIQETVRILRDVASALAYAHSHGIVHRDIKPENILISGGSAVVTDFGVAKALVSSSIVEADTLTSAGMALGTPAYMSPEQATADRNTDHRADIYALGVVGYEMISGTTPFVAGSQQAMLAAHLLKKPEPVSDRRESVPAGLATIVMSCLAKRPADRIQTADEVVRQLDAVNISGGVVAAAAATTTSPAVTSVPIESRHRFRRSALAKGGAVVVTTLLLTATTLFWPKLHRRQVDLPDEWIGVDSAIYQYAKAIESRDIGAVKRVYPTLSDSAQERFEQFFRMVPSSKVSLDIERIEGSDFSVEAVVDGEYRYEARGPDGKKPTVNRARFIATLQGSCPNTAATNCGRRAVWRIVATKALDERK